MGAALLLHPENLVISRGLSHFMQEKLWRRGVKSGKSSKMIRKRQEAIDR